MKQSILQRYQPLYLSYETEKKGGEGDLKHCDRREKRFEQRGPSQRYITLSLEENWTAWDELEIGNECAVIRELNQYMT